MYWFSFREEGSFEIGRATSRGWKKFGRRWTRGVGGLENWTIFIDVICLSSLTSFMNLGFIKYYQSFLQQVVLTEVAIFISQPNLKML